MRTIKHRLAKLEKDKLAGARFFAFAAAGKISYQAIAPQYPDGTPENATATVFGWGDWR